MDIQPIPCLKDNYAYLLTCPQTNQCAVVDPSESAPILDALSDTKGRLVAILNTHHHWDHVGGNRDLLERWPKLAVYGHDSDADRLPGMNRRLQGGDSLSFGHQVGRALHNPGHTSGALTYVFGDAAFTGDTLFAAGCGRLFEGTPAQMHHSMNQVIGSLPDHTRLYFGHEYTAKNLRFAQAIEPNNSAISEKLERVEQQVSEGAFTTPTRLADEWLTNPFMRCREAAVLDFVRVTDPGNTLEPASVFRVLRQAKDAF